MDFDKELAQTVEMLPQQPPEETVQVLTDRGLLKGDALVYKVAWIPGETGKKKKVVQVTCTACGANMYLEHVPMEEPFCSTYCYRPPYTFMHPDFKEPAEHGSPTLCPNCGAQADVRHVSSFPGSELTIAHCGCVSVHEVNGHLCLLAWDVYKNTNKNGKISYSKRRTQGIIVIGKKIVRLVGYVAANYHSGWYLPKWESRKTYKETFGPVSKKHVIPFKRKTVHATDSENCALYEFMNSNAISRPTMFLRLWRRYPQVENIVKSGFGKLLNSVLEDATANTYYNHETMNLEKIKEIFDLKKVKPSEMLKISKQEIQIAKLCDLDTFKLYQYLREARGFRMTIEYIKKAEKLGSSKLLRLFERYSVPPIRAINYIEKQRKLSSLADGGFLSDYWNMLKNVYEGIPAELQFPRDLKKAHDEVLALQKEKEERELSEKILEESKKFESMCYKNDDLQLMIRPCHSQAELITEGKLLNHCVARYAQSVSKGETMIFFIRKMEFPNDPFYTLEFRSGKVIQNRGKGNCSRTKEVELFENLWLDHIKKIRRKKDGNNSNSADAAS